MHLFITQYFYCMKTTTILIADDHLLIRETWSYILNSQPGMSVAGSVGSGREAVDLACHLRPDIVLMDINLPDISGIEATAQLLKCSPQSRVLAVSLHTQPAYARRMMQKGARGYVTKSSSRQEMLYAIQEVLNGRTYICQEIKDILSDQVISRADRQPDLNGLTAREIEIITHISKGASSRDIAGELGLSLKTVEVHRYNILRKLQLKNTAALINFITRSPLGLTP